MFINNHDNNHKQPQEKTAMSTQTQPSMLTEALKRKKDDNPKLKRKSKYTLPEDKFSKAKKATAGTPTSPSRNRAGKPLVDFYVFASLPAEIQDEVWENVCFDNPATIHIVVENHAINMVYPLPKLPALLHATSGARAIGLRYFEVLESFDRFDREAPLPVWVAPFVPAPALNAVHGPAPAPPGWFAPGNQNVVAAAPVAWLNVPAANHGGGFGQYGPGHVLGGNNTNTGTLTNTVPVNPNPGPPGLFGGNAGSAGNGGHGVNQVNGGVDRDDTRPNGKEDPTHVILFGAIPVLAGHVVGYCDTPPPTHPFLPAEPARQVLPGRIGKQKFYVNFAADMFKLQIGNPSQYQYPTFSLGEEPSVTCVKNGMITGLEFEQQVRAFQRKYEALPSFPTPGKVPALFKKIENLVLNISLPPCTDPDEYTEWATKNVKTLFSSLHVRTTIRRFPNLRSLNFYVPGDHKINPVGHKYSLKHFSLVPVRASDNISMSKSQLTFFEMQMETEMDTIRKELGEKDFPASRLVVYVPQKGDRMEWDADFVD
ncbi:hypothetical protein BKA65DRAFT_472635 [Rhexocercosporidium sp. MPI-PUGE-AT-0058]|nr:hypothetical protein BKA65DRAFT_472635 [Rhexocercosporidium sp. MPI-PUGE-AT-0058]